MTILDQDTARFLVSEALKDRLKIKTADPVEEKSAESIVAEFNFTTSIGNFTYSGPMLSLENMDNDQIYCEISSNIKDTHEFLRLSKDTAFLCTGYNITFLGNEVKVVENFKPYIRKLSNFDYGKNFCVIHIELIKN